jgi:y4mF family transcriptional regulator
MYKLSQFVKSKRKSVGLTQEELSYKSGVGLRFIRELEQGKVSLQMNKVNQVLALFGHELSPTPIDRNETR